MKDKIHPKYYDDAQVVCACGNSFTTHSTVKAIKGLNNLMGSGDTDVGRIAQGIYARLDKATTAAEMRAAALDEQIDNVLYHSAVDSQLAERREKLGLNE